MVTGDIVISAVQGTAGLALLYFGGEWLIRGASALAFRLGLPAMAIGLTVVAFGTSAPELVVSLDAALSGANDVSVGNVVGSNIANLTLILGVAALLRPMAVRLKMINLDAPLMVGISLLLVLALADGGTSRLEGGLLCAGLVAYIAYTLWQARKQPGMLRASRANASLARLSLGMSLLYTAAGVGVLVAGGHLLVVAAVDLATVLGMSQAAIGLTIVAVGTSLPELATTVIASLRRQGDIAIGNAVGSNIFNVLGIFGITSVVTPLRLGQVGWFDLATMVALAGLVTIFLYTHRRLDRIEGALLLSSFVLYTAWRLGG